MPPAHNDPIAPAPDGKKSSLGKPFLDRFKGPKSTESSSASSTFATQSTENRTAPSAADEKPSFSKRLLAPFKGSKFIKSSSAPSTPAAQSVENLAAPSASAAQLVANTGVFIAPAVRAATSAQGIAVAGTTSAMNVHQGSPATTAAAGPMSAMNIDERSLATAVPNPGVSHNNPATVDPLLAARNPVPLTNINQSARPDPNISQDQSKFREGLNVALDGFLTVLGVAKEASDWNPFFKAALGGIVAVIDLAKTVSSNSQDMKDTLVRIQGFLPILETSAKRLEGRKDDFGRENNLMTFAIIMQTELEKIHEMQSHGLFRRVLQGTPDADTLLGVYKNISEALEQFKVAFLVAIEHDTSTNRQ
ncbi:hypothetical protein DXG01_017166, partial [Tephrocybe rancida]